MRVLVHSLVFSMLMATACKPIARTSEAYEENERKEKMSWKKKVLIVAGTGLAIFGGFKLAKHLDRIVGQKLLQDIENSALLSRHGAILKNFKLEYERLPLYKMTAPDGSEHWLLGTMHTTGLSIDDLPANSRVLSAFEESTTFLPESEIDSAWRSAKLSIHAAREQMQNMNVNFNLHQALGDEHMHKLNDELSQLLTQVKSEVGIGSNTKEIQEAEKTISSIKQMLPSHALGTLDFISHNLSFGRQGMEMDVQLLRKAREMGKKVSGLEKRGEGVNALITSSSTASPDDPAAIERLRRFIDAGGIDNRTREYDEIRAAYVSGDIDRTNKLLSKVMSDDVKKILLSDRNQNWIKRGNIQKNCKQGKKCMVAVGLSHLVEGDNTLVELLTKEGFRIEKMQ